MSSFLNKNYYDLLEIEKILCLDMVFYYILQYNTHKQLIEDCNEIKKITDEINDKKKEIERINLNVSVLLLLFIEV